jgi:inorganic pyrophosphatase
MSPSQADFPEVVEVVVEIPAAAATSTSGTRRPASSGSTAVLASAVHYNFDYGFISDTRAGDGDHTDALLLIDEPTFPGCRVWPDPSAAWRCATTRAGLQGPVRRRRGSPSGHVERLDQVRPHRLVEIEHFFNTYKLLEAKETDVVGWRDAPIAREVLVADRDTWRAEQSSGVGVRPR